MKYIYDIKLNFNNEFYEFYEWEKKDKITHMNKIPSYKITNKDIYNLKYNTIKVNKDFFKNKNQTFIFSNGYSVIAVKFNNKGYNKLKSDINIENQEEIINIINNQKTIKLNYKIIKKEKIEFKTRIEKENKNKLIKKITEIYNNKEYNKINYIYLECFNNKNNSVEKKYNIIKKEIIKGKDNFYKIFNIFKLISQK